MIKNMANIDRIIRTLFAIVVAILYFTGNISGTVAIILGIMAVIFILTGTSGYCPIYHVLGISTKKK